jgi:hypothetical protein
MRRKTVPPYYSTGDPGSFAMNTMKKRKIRIIEQLLGLDQRTSDEKRVLSALAEEVLHGLVSDPFEQPLTSCELFEEEEIKSWRKSIAPYRNQPWLNIPFYFAEAYLYLRILIACGYFEPGSPSYGKDPFCTLKERELLAPGGGLDAGTRVLKILEGTRNPGEKGRMLLLNCLWGNKIDLSMFHLAESSKQILFTDPEENLLIDDSQSLAVLLRKSCRVDVILDNVGSELVCDLLLAWHFLTSSDGVFHFHAKKHPIYVSDAMPKDVENTVSAIASDSDRMLSASGLKLHNFLKSGRMHLHCHHFWNSPLHYNELPGDIKNDLLRSDLIILKGDVNYRRLLQDRRWDSWESLQELTPYFPSPFATLRTMKSEIVVDISRVQVQLLSQTDPEWRVNGKRGIIQLVERNQGSKTHAENRSFSGRARPTV